MASFSGSIPSSSTRSSSLLSRRSNDGNGSPTKVGLISSTPNFNVPSAVPSMEMFTGSPISTTGSASVLDWNSNSDGDFLELDASQLTGPTKVDDNALQQRSGGRRSSSSLGVRETVNTMTTTIRRLSLEEVAVLQFDSFPSSPSSLSASLSPAVSAPRNVVNEVASPIVVNDLSSDTIFEEDEQPHQITENIVASGDLPLQEESPYRAPLTSSIVAKTAGSPSSKEAVETWKARLPVQVEESFPAKFEVEASTATATQSHSPALVDDSHSCGDELEEQPSMATVTQRQIRQAPTAMEPFTCSLFEPPSKSASPSGSRLSYASEPSNVAGPSTSVAFIPPPSSPWYRGASITPPPVGYTYAPAALVSPFASPRSLSYPPDSRTGSPYPTITPLGRIDTPGSFFSPLLPPAQLESPSSIMSPRLPLRDSPSVDDSPPRTSSTSSQDSPRSIQSIPLPYVSKDSPRSIISPPVPLPPTPPVRRRSSEVYGYPDAQRVLRQDYGRFSPEGAVYAGLGTPDVETWYRPAPLDVGTEAPSWFKASTQDKILAGADVYPVPRYMNTSSSSTLASSSSTKPRPPLPPVPTNVQPHVTRAPEAPLPTWPMTGNFTFGLNHLASPPSRERSSDTMRSVPLLSPPGGYATLPGGVTSSEAPRVYSYSPSPSVSPAYSPSSAGERKSVYGSRTPSPALRQEGSYRPTMGRLAPAVTGGSVASFAGPPPSAQRRLRFAPLPPTPGSSLRASVFTPSPYPAAYTPAHLSSHHAGPSNASSQMGVASQGPMGLASATLPGGGGQHQAQQQMAANSAYPMFPTRIGVPELSYRPPVPPNQHYGVSSMPSSAPATSGNFRIVSSQQVPSGVGGTNLAQASTSAHPIDQPQHDMQRQLHLLQQVAEGVPSPLAGRVPPIAPQAPTSAPSTFTSFPNAPVTLPPLAPSRQPSNSWMPTQQASTFMNSSRYTVCMICKWAGPCTCLKPMTAPAASAQLPFIGPPYVQATPNPVSTFGSAGPSARAPSLPRIQTRQPLPTPSTFAPVSAPVQTGAAPFTTATPHPSFWFPDGTVIFEAENFLFKVHKLFFLRHSELFRSLLGSRPPTAPPSLPHIKLAEVKKVDFERLLYIFYPTSYTSPDLTTVEEWTSVLTLAHKWQLADIKSLAIQKLGPLASPVDKIALSRNFNLTNIQTNTVHVKQDWLLPAYTELCSKNSPLNLEQAERLDMATVVKIWEVQHEIMNWPGAYYGPQIMALVKDKFGLE